MMFTQFWQFVIFYAVAFFIYYIPALWYVFFESAVIKLFIQHCKPVQTEEDLHIDLTVTDLANTSTNFFLKAEYMNDTLATKFISKT